MSKKERFYIQIKEIFDNGFALGSMQDYVDIMNDLDKQNENKYKQIAELKQQLAEKDKKIKEHNQDKLSFAVEQLTQAKEYINKSLEYMWNNNAEMTCIDRGIIDGIYTKLDEQIAELTHQHEDNGE